MGEYKNKAYNLRLEPDMMAKVRFIADEAERPLSNQFKIIIRDYLERYEAEHGAIPIQTSGQQPE